MTNEETAKKDYKRWYDHDPLLLEALEVLRDYESELKSQAEQFLEKIAQEVGQETIDQYYQEIIDSRGGKFGRRWYDKDPVLSKAVELLRVAPLEAQQRIAEQFLDSLKQES